MSDENGPRKGIYSILTTLPGCLGGIAAVITAIGGLIAILYNLELIGTTPHPTPNSAPPIVIPAPPSPATPDPISGPTELLIATGVLKTGQELLSINKRYSFKYQNDGDLKVYENITSKTLWSSGTKGKKSDRLVMQDDGNLVLYAEDGVTIWASKTNYNPGNYFLLMQDDGNLVIYQGKPYTENPPIVLWATDTNQ